MIRQSLDNLDDHWDVCATCAYSGVHDAKVLVHLQKNGERVCVDMSAEQAKALAHELLRHAEALSAAESIQDTAGKIPAPDHVAVREAAARGANRLVTWTQDGTLAPVPMLLEAWELSADTVEAAIEVGSLFAVTVNGVRYVPASWCDLSADDVMQVCRAQKELSPVTQLVFWKRPHGALGARTPAATLHSRELARVEALAHSWSA